MPAALCSSTSPTMGEPRSRWHRDVTYDIKGLRDIFVGPPPTWVGQLLGGGVSRSGTRAPQTLPNLIKPHHLRGAHHSFVRSRGDMSSTWLPIGTFARQRGISIQTARRWADAGMVEVSYTVGGHRRFRAPDGRLSSRPVQFQASTAHLAQTEGHEHPGPPHPARASANPLSQMPQPSRPVHNPMRTLLDGIHRLRTSGAPVVVSRIDDTGRQLPLTTVSGYEFSLAWVKQSFGGGRFAANGVQFLVDGPPRRGGTMPY